MKIENLSRKELRRLKYLMCKYTIGFWMLSINRKRDNLRSLKDELLEQKESYGYKVSNILRDRIDDQLEIFMLSEKAEMTIQETDYMWTEIYSERRKEGSEYKKNEKADPTR